MLTIVDNINSHAVDQLFSLYSESMQDLLKSFSSAEEMKAAYTSFLTEILSHPRQFILVEESNDVWVSGLRAIETASGSWFIEAVETKPETRRMGFGQALLRHTIDYLQTLDMTEVFCQIHKNNLKSQSLHRKCGFLPTDEPSIDPWGQLDENTILFRLSVRV